jgi:hypothetical protein
MFGAGSLSAKMSWSGVASLGRGQQSSLFSGITQEGGFQMSDLQAASKLERAACVMSVSVDADPAGGGLTSSVTSSNVHLSHAAWIDLSLGIRTVSNKSAFVRGYFFLMSPGLQGLSLMLKWQSLVGVFSSGSIRRLWPFQCQFLMATKELSGPT